MMGEKTMFRLIFSFLIFILFLPNDLSAHSGRTDSNCGHNCSAESKRKGLCTGYHYHYANCPSVEVAEGETQSLKECSVLEKTLHTHFHDAEGNHIASEEHHAHDEDVSHVHKESK